MLEKTLKFTTEMLQAIRDNRKTQTRRPLDPQPTLTKGGQHWLWGDAAWTAERPHIPIGPTLDSPLDYCPYGQPGTRHTLEDGTVIEITEIRAERVQDITEADAVAEGCTAPKLPDEIEPMPGDFVAGPITGFAILWNSIYGPNAWFCNDWVWAITFKRVEPC